MSKRERRTLLKDRMEAEMDERERSAKRQKKQEEIKVEGPKEIQSLAGKVASKAREATSWERKTGFAKEGLRIGVDTGVNALMHATRPLGGHVETEVEKAARKENAFDAIVSINVMKGLHVIVDKDTMKICPSARQVFGPIYARVGRTLDDYVQEAFASLATNGITDIKGHLAAGEAEMDAFFS